METTVYNTSGGSTGQVELPESLFAQPLRADMLHRVVETARANTRQPVAHTKDRRDRRGGGTKPWQQKGTGRARHGSVRSPLWRKGGVTFGPKKSSKPQKQVNQKEKQAAVGSALSAKHDDGEVLLLDELGISTPNASAVRDLLDNLGEIEGFKELADRRNNTALFVLPEISESAELSFRNFGNLQLQTAQDLNALDLLTYRYTVITQPEAVLSTLTDRVKQAVN